MSYLVVIAVVLGVILVKTYLDIAQLMLKLNGKQDFSVTNRESNNQATLFIVFGIAFAIFIIWQLQGWGDKLLPESASVHGVDYDILMNISLWLCAVVFVITHIVLIGVIWKNRYQNGRIASFFNHSNKLELVWTIIPSIGLAVLISYGLYNWNSLMKPVDESIEHTKIELYAKQFDWTARYAGEDMTFGAANVSYIGETNKLGLNPTDANAKDDKIVTGEFHIPVDLPVQFVMRSQDVIHSAYMPHFRAQMNCVPGLKTQFNFIPKFTTEEMREITGNEEFDYVLLCNKICGAAHFNMQMKIVVDTPEDYKAWLEQQEAVTL